MGRVPAHFFLQLAYVASVFDTNSYGESWDSSCENSWVPVQNQWVPFKKKKEPEIENAWAVMYMQPDS